MRKFKKYFRVYFYILRRSLMINLAYRFDFLVWSFVHLTVLVVNVLMFGVIYARTEAVGGWNLYEVLILLGFVDILLGVSSLTFAPMMYGFDRKVREGELDWDLVKPMDIQFLMSFPWSDTADIFSIPLGILVMIFGLWKLSPPHLFLNFAAFLVLTFCSIIILYSVLVLVLSLAFKFTKLESLWNFYWTVFFLGRYPVSVFKGIVRTVLIYVIPVGLVMSVPARTLAGSFDSGLFFYTLGLTAVLFVISRKVFLTNIKNYASASS